MTTVSRTVIRTAKRGCGSPAALLFAAETQTKAPDFCEPDARIAPLARASAIVHLLQTAGGPLRVHPQDKTSVFPLLPPDDAAWVVETSADVILPLPEPPIRARSCRSSPARTETPDGRVPSVPPAPGSS